MSDQPSRRQSFPFPQELRDAVYGHLLNAELADARSGNSNNQTDVHENQGFQMAMPYRFSTSIMAVNRTMAVEATKVFHRNTFILIVYRSTTLAGLMRAFQVPVVFIDDFHSTRTPLWSVRLDITIPDHKLNVFEDDEYRGQLMIVAKDLPLFCQALQWAFFGHRTSVQLVMRNPDRDVQAALVAMQLNNGAHPPALTVTFRSLENAGEAGTVNKPMTEHIEKIVINTLCQCTAGGLMTFVKGSVTGDRVLRRQMAPMGPRIIWLPAMAWNLLDSIDAVHVLIDGLWQQGKMNQIFELCQWIAEQLRLNLAFNKTAKASINDASDPLSRTISIAQDIFAYGFAAGLKSEDWHATEHVMYQYSTWAQEILPSASWQPLSAALLPRIDSEAPRHPIKMWCDTVGKAIVALSTPTSLYYLAARIWDLFDAELKVLAESAEAMPEATFMAHDVAVMTALQRNLDVQPDPIVKRQEAMNFIAKLSVNQMEKVSFKMPLAYEYQVPVEMDHWVDQRLGPVFRR